MKKLVTPFFVYLLLLLNNQAFATTIYVKQNATGLNNGSSWANALNDFQNALNLATAGDTIWVAAGIYTPKQDFSGNGSPTDPRTKTFSIKKDNIKIYGGFVGTETSLNQRNTFLNVTNISGDIGASGNNSDNSYNVLRVISNATDGSITNATVIDGFKISHGMASSRSGAGVYLQTGIGLETSPTFSNNIFSSNSATNYGGAIFMETTNGGFCNPIITSNIFEWSGANNGGGIASYCSNSGTCNPIISTNTFMNCQANFGGGAIYLESNISGNSSVSIFNNFFSLNTANGGGAVYTKNSNNLSVSIINNTFHSNTALTANGGGAIGLFNSGSTPSICTIKNSIFWNNGVNYYQGNQVNTTIDYCIYDDGTINGIVVLPANVTGTNNLDVDPLVDPFNYDIAPCSPAIDAGNNSFWASTGLNSDIRSTTRPFNGIIDIGAVEFPMVYTVPTITATAFPCTPQGSMIVVNSNTVNPMEYSIDSGATWQTSDTFFFLNPGNYNVVGRAAGVTACPVYDASNPVVMPFPCCYNGVIYVDINATGNNYGSSWADAFTDLQDALDYYCGNNEIWVAAGTYKPIRYNNNVNPANRFNSYIIKKDMPLYGGFNGTETLLNQRNITTNQTIISGDIGVLNDNTDNIAQLLFIDASAEPISNMTIIDGFYFQDAYDDFSGLNAPIYINGRQSVCSPIFRNNTITNLWTNSYGCVYVEAMDGVASPQFRNNTFNNNLAYSGGSAINAAVFGTGHINLLVDSCNFTNNGSNNTGDGGAIFRYPHPTGSFYMTVTNSLFDNNGKEAISVKGKEVTVSNNTFSNNFGYTGAVTIDSDSAFVINNTFLNNQSDYRGGGLTIYGAAHVYNNVFEGNTAMNGGGAICIFASTSSAAPMSPLYANNLFYNNSASDKGGAIFIDANPNTSKSQLFINNTFYGNSATNNGGAIYNKSTGQQNQIINSIFWNNNDEISSTTPLQLNYSILDDNLIDNSVLLPTNVTGSNNLDSDPLFVNTSIGDFKLQNNSPAIDAGNTATWNTTGLTTDLLGNTRPHAGLTVDLGAYESSIILSTKWVTTISPKAYPNPTSNNISIELGEVLHDLNIQVYSISGALVQKEFFGSQNLIHLSLKGATGVYVVKITSDTRVLGHINVLKK